MRSALRLFCLALVLVVSPALTVPAVAIGILVNDFTDTAHPMGCAITGTGTCSLQDAINFANSNMGADVITFSMSGTIPLSATLPNVDDTLTIDGTGQHVTISGNDLVRVMSLNAGKALTLNALTIAHGNSGPGGGINSGGTLTVTNCTFTENQATGFGGAIAGTDLFITNSTFFNNFGALGFGIFLSGSATIINSTFYKNDGDFLLVGGHATFTNTILGGTTLSVPSCQAAFMGTSTDGGHNLEEGGSSCGFAGTGCATAVGTSLCNISPQVDPAGLAGNGGPTQTLAVCTAANSPASCTAASPAIDAGDEAVCAASPVNGLDQRGFARPGSGSTRCTIGAFEANAMPPSRGSGVPAPALSPVGLLVLTALLSVAGWHKARAKSQAGC